jgi:acylphosphatase
MKAISVNITGIVQGVFFRKHTKDKADELGVHGWVKNEDDGSVSAYAEGSEEQLKSFIQYCHIGPEKARVDRVDVRDTDIEGYSSFEVRR